MTPGMTSRTSSHCATTVAPASGSPETASTTRPRISFAAYMAGSARADTAKPASAMPRTMKKRGFTRASSHLVDHPGAALVLDEIDHEDAVHTVDGAVDGVFGGVRRDRRPLKLRIRPADRPPVRHPLVEHGPVFLLRSGPE